MSTYRPLGAAQCERLRAALSCAGEISLDQFVALRRQVSGQPLALEGLRALVTAEPELVSELQAHILPSIVHYAQTLLAHGQPELLMHVAKQPARTVISRAEAAGFIAHMFLGTLPQPTPAHPEVDFAPLLSSRGSPQLAKLRCVLSYFGRIAKAPPLGVLEVERIVAAVRTEEEWAADSSPLLPLTLDGEAVIENADGCRQVDFANRYLGGGVLGGGCVQEEIRFAVAPELFFGMLVSPYMHEPEAIVLRGAERFAQTSGYARSLKFAGEFSDPAPRAADGTPDIELVAIDAVDYRNIDPSAQFSKAAILRELGKARSGFLRDARQLPIATGNWGCGAFGGEPAIKAVVQWLAASAEGRTLRYFSFGDARVGDLAGFSAATRGVTVGTLFQRLLALPQKSGAGLYQRLLAT